MATGALGASALSVDCSCGIALRRLTSKLRATNVIEEEVEVSELGKLLI